MNTRTQTDIWIFHIAIVLGIILVASIGAILVSAIVKHSMPDLLIVLGTVAGAGLAKLLISPLSHGAIDQGS